MDNAIEQKKKTRRGKRGGKKANPEEEGLKVNESSNSFTKAMDVDGMNLGKESKEGEKKKQRRRGKRGGDKKKAESNEAEMEIEQPVEEVQAPIAEPEDFQSSQQPASLLPMVKTEIKTYLMSIEKKLELDEFEDEEGLSPPRI